MTFTPFSDSEITGLEQTFQTAVESCPESPLNSVARFPGGGVYVLRYNGSHPAYTALGSNPIYVGKAIPAGGRKGLTVSETGNPLYNRIQQHKKSIEAATNLDVADFTVQWLVVDPMWITLCEGLLIQHWRPVWNAVVDGFGNHDPGAGRREGMISRWDSLHPGRSWSAIGQPRTETPESITETIRVFLESK